MSRVFAAGLLLCIFSCSTSYAAVDSKKYFVFSDKEKAQLFVEKQKKSGKTANLTTQKQPEKRFFVLLKGYKQWAPAFKQAQTLMKQGFSDVEVTKGRFERAYSVLVSGYLDKKAAGKAFNTLKRMGLRNVKVHTDTVSQFRYIVAVHTVEITKPEVIATKGIAAKPTPVKRKTAKVKPQQPIEKQDELVRDARTDPGSQSVTDKIESPTTSPDEISLLDTDETMIIVMSDTPDLTYEIAIDDSDTEDALQWGANFSLEEDLFTRSIQDANHTSYIHGDVYLEKQFNNQWDIKLSARADGTYQRGKQTTDYSDTDLDYGDSYIRYRDEAYRITVGAQTIRWGRVDNLGPIDNMATQDLSRGTLLKWGENYRASPALRLESFLDQAKLDFVYLPKFREAELADQEDVWYPIDFRKGRMLGFVSNPLMEPLIQNARINDDIDGDGGFGVRYSTTVKSLDIALSVQRVRLSAPYYSLNEEIAQAIRTNNQASVAFAAANSPYTFKEEHPRSWVVGADAAFIWKSVTWRMEAGWFSDMPATTSNLEYKTYTGFQWASSAEFYPGDADTRINLQLSGRHIDEQDKILDLDNVVALSGEVESLFANNRWKMSGRFNIGLSEKEYLLSPEITFLGWEPFEIYAAYHYIDGAEQTIGGFYQGNNMLTFGFRGKY